MKSEADRRSKVLHVRLAPALEAALAGEAEARGETLSGFVRGVLTETGGFGPMLEDADRAAMGRLAEEVRAVGVNLNQAVRALNSGKVPPQGELAGLVVELAEMFAAMRGQLVSMCERGRLRRVEALADGEGGG